MNDQARKLYDLLGRLGARPEGLDMETDSPCWHDGYEYMPIQKDHALAILCDAARRVCDLHGYKIERIYGDSPEYQLFTPMDGSYLHDDYESALIAGLEWIEENRNDE